MWRTIQDTSPFPMKDSFIINRPSTYQGIIVGKSHCLFLCDPINLMVLFHLWVKSSRRHQYAISEESYKYFVGVEIRLLPSMLCHVSTTLFSYLSLICWSGLSSSILPYIFSVGINVYKYIVFSGESTYTSLFCLTR